MEVFILNLSRVRVAIDKYVKKHGASSMSEIMKKNHFDTSIISRAQKRFDKNFADIVSFSLDDYTSYGAMYEDTWKQLCDMFDLNSDDFVLERKIDHTSKRNTLSSLKLRVTELEERYLALANEVEQLRKRG